MSDYVLFSNIGGSDPIRGEFDGPFLHIIRHYKPKKVYIFLTKEMYERDDEYNPYEKAAKVLDKDIEIIKRGDRELDTPSDFSKFDKLYENILDEIIRDNPNSEILINITSGTPQMICSLYNITANSKKPCKLIQVLSPEGKANTAQPLRDFSNIEDLVSEFLNFDSDKIKKTNNRCNEIKPDNIRRQTIKKIIENHIRAYDYEGAYETVIEAKDLIDKEIIESLIFLKDRNRLNFDKLPKCSLPIETTKFRDIYEYILYLQNRLKRNEILEFTRGISPILTDLFEIYLKEVYQIDIKKYCYKENNKYKLEKINMPIEVQKVYDDSFYGEYRTSDLSSKNIEPYLFYFATKEKNKKLIEILEQLKEFETHFRNIAAHQIAFINDSEIKKHMKKKFNKEIGLNHILSYLKYLFQVSFSKNCKDQIDWNSYDNMNQKILEKLNDRGEKSGVLSESCN